ncbi:MAG: hypothetical protein ACLGQX_15390 [Acidobacteriota bacterium]
MRSRSREINIFNMSLLDILSGALGAFCFLMLALFPYYKPSHLSAEDQKTYQDAEQMQRKIQQLEDALRRQSGAASADMMQRMEQALEQARQQLAQTQQQLSRTRAEMEQAEQQAQNQGSQRQETPVMTIQDWWPSDEPRIDMYVLQPGEGANGQTAPAFDPTKYQSAFFDSTYVLGESGSISWTFGNLLAGNYLVYYRFHNASDATEPVNIDGQIQLNGQHADIPQVTLGPGHLWAQAATVVVSQDGKLSISPAGIQ